MNNEPVAIVNTNYENNIQWYDDNPKQYNGYFLYTHPAELTDEEIYKLYEESYLEVSPIESEFDPVYFAKAILRKAQEK